MFDYLNVTHEFITSCMQKSCWTSCSVSCTQLLMIFEEQSAQVFFAYPVCCIWCSRFIFLFNQDDDCLHSYQNVACSYKKVKPSKLSLISNHNKICCKFQQSWLNELDMHQFVIHNSCQVHLKGFLSKCIFENLVKFTENTCVIAFCLTKGWSDLMLGTGVR